MSLLTSGILCNVSCETRSARTCIFCIFATDSPPECNPIPCIFLPMPVPFTRPANPRIHPWSDPAQRDPIPGLKENP